MSGLNGKTALVTGASRGIGRYVACIEAAGHAFTLRTDLADRMLRTLGHAAGQPSSLPSWRPRRLILNGSNSISQFDQIKRSAPGSRFMTTED
jgi:hypothetical protein